MKLKKLTSMVAVPTLCHPPSTSTKHGHDNLSGNCRKNMDLWTWS